MPHILLIVCPDRVGLIHEVTGVLLRQRVNIISNDEFVDADSGLFFMRTEFIGEIDSTTLTREILRALTSEADVRVAPARAKRIVVMGGKEPHCVADLLMRQFNGELAVQIAAVISNHLSLEPMVSRFGVPFFHIPLVGEDRATQERLVRERIDEFAPDYIVLAKYMRVLSKDFIDRFPYRIINIHHSFLPAFVGAQPYRQAYERGVKIIGATAHFVTEKLDDGPIISQSVLSVSHAHTAKSMAQEGREIEKLVLAQAVRLVIEDRVFVSRNKTIIFQ